MLSQGEPRDAAENFDTYRILQRHRAVSLLLHDFLNHRPTFRRWYYESIFVEIFLVGSVNFILQQWRFGRTFKVSHGHWFRHQSRACMRLPISHIMHRFGDIAGFWCSWPHPYSTLIFGVFPLHQITHVGVSPSRSLELLATIRPWNYFRSIPKIFQPVWKTYMNVTDRQTDDILSHNRALLVSRSKNQIGCRFW